MKEYPYFPLFVDLSEKQIIVIGAGKIANRRIQVLSGFTENITVIAPEIHPEIEKLAEHKIIRILRKTYQGKDIDTADIVLAATDSRIINEQIYQDCKQRKILVNICNDHQKCDFYFPGIVRKDNLVIGVTASGINHGQAKQTTALIKQTLDGIP